MQRIFTSTALLLLVLTLGFWQQNAQAQCSYIQPEGVDIDPDVTPLEIVGGNLFGPTLPGAEVPLTTHDVVIYLNQGDSSNLHVAKVDQATLETQFSSFPVDSFTFGFADRIVNTVSTGLVTCFINGADGNGGTPTIAYSMDGLNFDTKPLAAADTYDSCAVIKDDPNDNFITDLLVFMAHNRATGNLDFWETDDGGQTWVLSPLTVPNVLGPTDGGVVPTFTRGADGTWITFHSRQTAPMVVESVLNNVNTQFALPLLLETEDGVLAETCSAEIDDKNLLAAYDRSKNQIRVWSYEDRYGFQPVEEPKNVYNAPAPMFQNDLGFFGIGCTHVTQGPNNPQGNNFIIAAPWGNTTSFKINDANEVRRTDPGRDVTRTTMSGPAALTKINTDIIDNPFGNFGVNEPLQGAALFMFGSLRYGQCVFGPSEIPIPTLSEWGLIALSGVFLLSGAFYLRRKKALG